MVKEPMQFLGKKIFISGEVRIDWAIYCRRTQQQSCELVHRSESFQTHKG